MLLLFRFLALLPLVLLHAMGKMAGFCVYELRPRYRNRLLSNLQQAEVCEPDKCKKLARHVAGQSGCAVMELPKLWLSSTSGINKFVKQVQGFDQAIANRSEGQGVVFLTPHLGSFELAGQYIGSKIPLTAMYRPPREAKIEPIMRAGRERFYANLAPTNLRGVRMLVRALRSGEAIGLLPDQVPVSGEGVWVPFFGRMAYTMTLAPKLILATEARTVLTWAERLSCGRGYILKFIKLDFESDDEAGLALEINSAMERVIRTLPGQYLWSYNRYKMPRVKETR
ncbi:MAG: lysophospholipid acyltransferase family protein [Pseudomonadota bacterium]|nr:lysophospholipid acyltransferase family protein [Pseudomonadota bacterium]